MTQEFDPLDTRAHDAVKAKDDLTQRVKQDNEIADIKYLMSQPQGRRFVFRLLEKAGVWKSSFSANGLEMAFKEGNRNTGLWLVTEVTEHCPNFYSKMLRENQSARSRTAAG